VTSAEGAKSVGNALNRGCSPLRTGFDVPSLHTMYLDKPMKGHNLMQAIARVNRVYKDKSGGLGSGYSDRQEEPLCVGYSC